MSTPSLEQSLHRWPKPRVVGSRLIVTTQCFYPSRNLVLAHIEGGESTAIVSDGGGAFNEIDAAGEYGFDPRRVLRAHLKKWNLEVDKKGWIYSGSVEHRHIPSMVAIVANASADAARILLSHVRPKKRDFRVELDKLLRQRFNGSPHSKQRLIGASNKSHEFDYVIDIGRGRRLVVDAVLPEATSINGTIVAHVDIKNAELDGVVQRIIYDDNEDWKSSDLSLLTVGATPLAFSRTNSAIDRLTKPIPA